MDVPPSDDEILNRCRTRFDSGEFGGRRATWTRETNGFVLAVLRCPSAMSHSNPLAPGTVARSPPSPLGLVHIREPFFFANPSGVRNWPQSYFRPSRTRSPLPQRPEFDFQAALTSPMRPIQPIVCGSRNPVLHST